MPEHYAFPSKDRLQALLYAAARMGRDDVIPELIRAGANLEGHDEKGHTALILASYNGRRSTTALLLSAGADVNAGDSQRGNTALMGISFKGYPEIARMLIDFGANVNAINAEGQTALMTAVLFGQNKIIDMLVKAGADSRIVDRRGNSVLSLAKSQGLSHLLERFSTD